MEIQKRAKVELIGSLTHEGRGRKFEKNKPQILTKPSDIAYYKAQSEFSVTDLAVPQQPAAKKPAATKKPAAAPVVEEDDEEDDEEEADEEAGDDEEETSEATAVLSKADLEQMTKAALVELGRDEFKLELNPEHTKPKLVGEILKAQIARAAAAEE